MILINYMPTSYMRADTVPETVSARINNFTQYWIKNNWYIISQLIGLFINLFASVAQSQFFYYINRNDFTGFLRMGTIFIVFAHGRHIINDQVQQW